MSENNLEYSDNQPQPKKSRNVGCLLGWFGLLLGFSPIILAFLLSYTSWGGNCSGISCGAVGAVYFLPFTLITGFVLGVIGIFKYLATPNSNE